MIVTVVTPTWNAIEFLKECIDSVERNHSADFEVEHVIVDGGSTDGTVEYAEARGLRVMKGKDKGIFDAINKGSFHSSGDLLGFLGGDDVMLDGALDAIVKAYGAGGQRWVVGGIRWIDERGVDLGGLAAPPLWMIPRIHVCLDWNPLMHMGTYISREFFVELGGFNIDYRDSGDFELFARAHSKAPFARVSREIACFRRTGHNNSAVNTARTLKENNAILDTFGPKSNAERVLWRYVLKAWFNLRNPSWMMYKRREAAERRRGKQAIAHF